MTTKTFQSIAVLELFTGFSLSNEGEDTVIDIMQYLFPGIENTGIEAGLKLIRNSIFTPENYPAFYELDYNLVYQGQLEIALSYLPNEITLSK